MKKVRILWLNLIICIIFCLANSQASCDSSPIISANDSDLDTVASLGSVSMVEPESFSLLDLPHELIHLMLPYLNPSSFISITATCIHTRSLLDDPAVTRRQLTTYGFLLPHSSRDVTYVSEVIFTTLPFLLELWHSGSYIELFRRRSEIADVLCRQAEEESDLYRQEILLRQSMLLGHMPSILRWRCVLHTHTPEIILDILTDVYTLSGVWVSRTSLDDIISYTLYMLPEGGRLLNSLEYTPLLKRLCNLGSFEIITWIQTLIRQGLNGFQQDLDLADDIACMMYQGHFGTKWQLVVHKKSSKLRKITLQDLIPRIMSAIDARKYE